METAGTQGAGVKTPIAADVAAITAGLVGAEHIPNEAMLVIGKKSIMFARCMPAINTVLDGFTVKGHGIMPKVQVINADVTTNSSPIPVTYEFSSIRLTMASTAFWSLFFTASSIAGASATGT